MFHCVINWTFRFSNLNERIFTLTLFITRTTKNESWVDDNFILKKIQTSSIEWTNPNSNFDFIRCHCELNVWQNNPSQKKTHTQNTCKFLSIFSFFLKTKKKTYDFPSHTKLIFYPKNTAITHCILNWLIQSHHNRSFTQFFESTKRIIFFCFCEF